MSRTVNCIKMLLLLQARGMMKSEEIAELLDCNVRNIREYRKELEEAGYEIEAIQGKDGGYQLKKGTLFPVVALSNEEYQAISEALLYMEHEPFRYSKAFRKAMEKFKATTSMKHYDQDYYLRSHLQNDDIDKRMMEQLAEAKRDCLWVKLQYKGTKDDDFQTIFIHPYELVHRHNSTYVVAYSLKVKDYRNFRVQATRMRNVEVLDKHFQRDSNFQLQDHIGTANLMRNEKIRLHLKIYGQSRRYIKESMIGQNRQIIAGENYDEVYLDLEGKESVISFLLTLRDEVEIISPPDIKTKMQEIIVNMQTKYNSY